VPRSSVSFVLGFRVRVNLELGLVQLHGLAVEVCKIMSPSGE